MGEHHGSTDTVTLRGGFTVPVKALQLAWRLEAADVAFRADGDVLRVRGAERLSLADRQAVTAARGDLVALMGYIQYGPVL